MKAPWVTATAGGSFFGCLGLKISIAKILEASPTQQHKAPTGHPTD